MIPNMLFKSTRGKDRVSIDEAILTGLAPDGGLYVPVSFPEYRIKDFYTHRNLIDFSSDLLAPFFSESKITIDMDFCRKVFTFPLPLHHLNNKSYVLELFHGPTLSFKDWGAQFFAQCLELLVQGTPTKVLVATSGDTGGAVAAALHGKKGIDGIILFPNDRISQRQRAQITCWGDNIYPVAVNGNFDQCQDLVKMAFSHSEHKGFLTTSNSINIARLLPQMIFYAHSSIECAIRHNQPVNYIVPSGNLGNVTACYWAKFLGFPIKQILIANNANKVLSEFLASGYYEPQPSQTTLATAMDVGNPSNLERLLDLFINFRELKRNLDVVSVTDDEIQHAITDCYSKYRYIICPHTATAYHRLTQIDSTEPWIIAATAHPAKFNELIEPLLNIIIPVPEQLKKQLKRTHKFPVIEPVYESLDFFLNN